ncbi:acyl-coa n-acyltransferase [Trichococcus palustris]|jgi:ElaA protein|uniref:Acyl-coa n-acyltransferase n=1 Tax=Trichococcus palustris TaxID=140314 RepID=A0A143YD14_9LACT|nr:GNAT family N-acetyltransferase [Trichococcus palustris]CZQ85382.1 acyl-coa n-acyltransferase [Trichococcus palustris]SFK55750.1 ElaA protein [Trichococcus palustris]
MWQIKKLSDLYSNEFYEILKLRIDTFVVEQQRIYHELDTNDKIAFHIFFQDESTGLVEAYARVFKTGNHVTFGRVVVSKESRGTGLGDRLVEEIIKVCKEEWPNAEVMIESQQQVIDFYRKHGFVQVGDIFEFEGTPHVEMKLQK